MAHKVVIIDDEPWTRGVILKLGQWNQLGLEVVGEAADGETGLELIYKVLPDIIITDVRMPRIGGLELVQKLREQVCRSCVHRRTYYQNQLSQHHTRRTLYMHCYRELHKLLYLPGSYSSSCGYLHQQV